jgi:electron transport complex protein RnfG
MNADQQSERWGERLAAYAQSLKVWLDLERLRPQLKFQAGVLAGFALLASILLGLAYSGTRDAVRQRLDEDLQKSLQEVVPESMHDNDLLRDTRSIPSAAYNIGAEQTLVYIGRKGGEVTAAAFMFVAPDGYSGAINMMMGLNSNGEILGVRVLKHSETPGLGDKIETAKSHWILKFNGHSLQDLSPAQWAVKKDGGVFDQFSGATITPRKTVQAIYRALKFFKEHREEIIQ